MAKKKTVKRVLSKVEKFYIEKNCSTSSLTDLCNDIGCPESIVSAFYNECLDRLKRQDTIDKLMISDKKNGCMVMTKEASEKGDATKPQRTVKLDTNHIHKIR